MEKENISDKPKVSYVRIVFGIVLILMSLPPFLGFIVNIFNNPGWAIGQFIVFLLLFRMGIRLIESKKLFESRKKRGKQIFPVILLIIALLILIYVIFFGGV